MHVVAITCIYSLPLLSSLCPSPLLSLSLSLSLLYLHPSSYLLHSVPPSLSQPPTFGYLEELTELWLDSNCLSLLPEVRLKSELDFMTYVSSSWQQSLSRLHKLYVLDVTKNKLERFPNHFANLVNLVDLHASENCIECLPDNFGGCGYGCGQ